MRLCLLYFMMLNGLALVGFYVDFLLKPTGELLGLCVFLCCKMQPNHRTATDALSPILFEFWSGSIYISLCGRLLSVSLTTVSTARAVLSLLVSPKCLEVA